MDQETVWSAERPTMEPMRAGVFNELLDARDQLAGEIKALTERLRPVLTSDEMTSQAVSQLSTPGQSALRDLQQSLVGLRMELTDLLKRIEL